MMLCPHVYGLEQYGHLNSSCPFCLVFCLILYVSNENTVGSDKKISYMSGLTMMVSKP